MAAIDLLNRLAMLRPSNVRRVTQSVDYGNATAHCVSINIPNVLSKRVAVRMIHMGAFDVRRAEEFIARSLKRKLKRALRKIA